ncbi:PucR family transcriptional regulator [Cohnella silvisoli]|uniref:PucR family transcriptional regulator ligand-binding domain-containing protein n=1 Tax=Cohnella silvisoli TaxID=2873699 RepID=A0ABV1KMB2_9BACL|nr:PucR family transcriptional regulator [Cohnella silvisoli]MCD9020460.1 PucR family transcriptional regulator ligand-binding domain-containing protein [Cohnella silvisoli]
MHITVEKALEIYPLSEGKLVAGKSGLSRILKSVNIIDAPDFIDWVKEGDMFFTTAYVIKDRLDDAIKLIRSLKMCGSAGLGIKLGRFWTEMPAELIEEADRLGFPLIELPYPFTFSDQINGLFQDELSRSTLILHTILDKQKKLMQLALRQTDGGNYFERISSVIEFPMAVVGGRGHILYNETPCSDGELMSDWPWESQVQKVVRGGVQLIRIPLSYQDETIGFGLFLPSTPLVSKAEEGLFHQASEMLAFYLGNMLVNSTESFLHLDLSTIMLRYLHKGASIDAVLQYAEKAGVNVLKGAYQCVICALHGISDEDREANLKAVRQELEFNPSIKERKGYHLTMEDGILSIYPAEGIGTGKSLAALFQTGLPFTQALCNARQVFALSSVKTRPERLAEAFSECLETLKIGERLHMKERVLQFETIQMAHLFQFVPAESMLRYCHYVLGPLLDSESVYDQEMLQTLQTYVFSDAQIGETAKQLFIHRNTAAYRLEKISETLRIDFKKSNDLLQLRLAFLFMQMLQGEDGQESLAAPVRRF